MIKSLNNKLLDNSGFTIIEMVVAMLIISIAVAFTVPNFNKIMGRYQLDISAREMASDIRDLQQAALKTQNPNLAIMWNTTDDVYYLMNGNTKNKTVQLPKSVGIHSAPYITNEAAYKMHFAVTGRPAAGFGGTVMLVGKNTGKFKYVIIDTLGRVRVSETPPES